MGEDCIQVGKPEETTKRPRSIWNNNIKIDLRGNRIAGGVAFGLDSSGSG
jgi:hypothetical protein